MTARFLLIPGKTRCHRQRLQFRSNHLATCPKARDYIIRWRSKLSSEIKVGVVAYDPKVVTIWEGIKEYFTARKVAMDFILFSNYDAQVDALLEGWVDIAWNTNLAYVKTYR